MRSGTFGKKLIKLGRETILKVVSLSLNAGHRITRILMVLNIPRTTYYDYLRWKPGETAIKRDLMDTLIK